MEDRENTTELKVDVWDTDMLDDIGDAINKLIDKFDAYNCSVPNYFKVTIVYMMEEEEHDDE